MTKSTKSTRSLRDQIIAVVFNGDADAAKRVQEQARSESGWQRVPGRRCLVFVCPSCGTHTPEGGSWSRQCCGDAFVNDLKRL